MLARDGRLRAGRARTGWRCGRPRPNAPERGPAAALRDARADVCLADASATAADDPVVTAAGWSFIALGA